MYALLLLLLLTPRFFSPPRGPSSPRLSVRPSPAQTKKRFPNERFFSVNKFIPLTCLMVIRDGMNPLPLDVVPGISASEVCTRIFLKYVPQPTSFGGCLCAPAPRLAYLALSWRSLAGGGLGCCWDFLLCLVSLPAFLDLVRAFGRAVQPLAFSSGLVLRCLCCGFGGSVTVMLLQHTRTKKN